jgi:hypothetical protein
VRSAVARKAIPSLVENPEDSPFKELIRTKTDTLGSRK